MKRYCHRDLIEAKEGERERRGEERGARGERRMGGRREERQQTCEHCDVYFTDKIKKDTQRSQFISEKYKEMKYASRENRIKILSESKPSHMTCHMTRHMVVT